MNVLQRIIRRQRVKAVKTFERQVNKAIDYAVGSTASVTKRSFDAAVAKPTTKATSSIKSRVAASREKRQANKAVRGAQPTRKERKAANQQHYANMYQQSLEALSDGRAVTWDGVRYTSVEQFQKAHKAPTTIKVLSYTRADGTPVKAHSKTVEKVKR